jgi:hypothetical protein
LNRDPIGEQGGMNVYAFVGNSPQNLQDHLGLCCTVKSFGLVFQSWFGGWPSTIWFGKKRGTKVYTKRISVKFKLEIDKCCDKKDCRIRQDVMGLVKIGGRTSEYPTWENDPGVALNWWDGASWSVAWSPKWYGRGDKKARWYDKPGFNMLESTDFPVYWGGVGQKGHFRFRTRIYDWSKPGSISAKLEAEITWGILIDYATPTSGREYFYK